MKRIILFTHMLVFVALHATAQSDAPKHERDQREEPRFPLKSLTAFHNVLHPLVHVAYPKGDYATIKDQLDELLKRGKAITKVRLPRKYAAKKDEFQVHSELLVAQLQSLVRSKETIDDKTLGRKFLEMHDQFERLAGLLTE